MRRPALADLVPVVDAAQAAGVSLTVGYERVRTRQWPGVRRDKKWHVPRAWLPQARHVEAQIREEQIRRAAAQDAERRAAWQHMTQALPGPHLVAEVQAVLDQLAGVVRLADGDLWRFGDQIAELRQQVALIAERVHTAAIEAALAAARPERGDGNALHESDARAAVCAAA